MLVCIYIPLVTQSVIPFNSTGNSLMSWDWNYLSSENINMWMAFFVCRNQASSSLNFACKIIVVVFFLIFFTIFTPILWHWGTLRYKGNILHCCNCQFNFWKYITAFVASRVCCAFSFKWENVLFGFFDNGRS